MCRVLSKRAIGIEIWSLGVCVPGGHNPNSNGWQHHTLTTAAWYINGTFVAGKRDSLPRGVYVQWKQ
jgi:hypothetical protein